MFNLSENGPVICIKIAIGPKLRRKTSMYRKLLKMNVWLSHFCIRHNQCLKVRRHSSMYLTNGKRLSVHYLNNRVFLSRNYRLIVAPRKFDVLKTNICPRSEVSRANMLVLRTSNFQGATIRPIVPRHKHSIAFIVHC